jgi:hypothetical protein
MNTGLMSGLRSEPSIPRWMGGSDPANDGLVLVADSSKEGAARLSLAARRDVATFTASGVLTVSTGTLRFPVYGIFTIIGALAMVGTAPTGAALIVDVLKNGTTIYSTTANRPTIPISGNVSQAMATPDVTSLVLNDYLTLNIAQIGSTIAGSDLTVVIIADRIG